MKSQDVLKTFAALSGNAPAAKTDVVDPSTFTWLTNSALDFFERTRLASGLIRVFEEPVGLPSLTGRQTRFDQTLDKLVSQAALHSGEQLIQLGWVWFAGTVEVSGEPTQFCFPAISLPMGRQLEESLGGVALGLVGAAASTFAGGLAASRQVHSGLVPVGDAEMTPLIGDADLRSELLERANFGDGKLYDTLDEMRQVRPVDPSVYSELPELMTWCADVADAVGITVETTYPLHSSIPTAQRKKSGISMHMGCALYLDQPASVGSRKSSLINLSNIADLSGTAFAKVYGESEITARKEREVIAVRPLSQRQTTIANRAAASDLVALSGAPGTGKSHVLSVVARNAVANGESVLVVAGSPHAVDVLVEHFSDTPGPTPVTFGGSRYGNRLAAELSELISRNEVPGRSTTAGSSHLGMAESAHRALRIETVALRIQNDPTYRIDVAADVDRAGDLIELREAIQKVLNPGFLKFGHKKRIATVNSRLGISASTSTDEQIETRIAEIEIGRDALRTIAAGGMTLSPRLDELHKTEAATARALGNEVTNAWIDGLGRSEKRTLAQISSAVTSNRSARRRTLAALDPEALTTAAPLWIGSVRDVDEVLPAVPGLFDVVILDEAAQIDQMNAASALVRAKRAIVCGDPNQLGHTSYVSTAAVANAAKTYGTDAELLNPRTTSVFDVAAAQVPVDVLDEHFRSAPHLIEFSSRRFYGGDLYVATRHPRNENADHIHISAVSGSRNAQKVNEAEVDECMRLIGEYAARGATSIGLISPFRAQADALEAAVLQKYRLEEIDAYGLRVGTVHGYQGDERDVLIVSFSIGADEPNSAWRFVNQRNLFNVMVTRAREELIVVTSNPEPPGLAGEYVQWAEPLTDLVRDVALDDPWVRRVAGALSEQGVAVRVGYRVGRHIVDIVAGVGEGAVAIDCGPHVDGASTHLDRALMLRRSGWKTADAFRTMWSDNPGRFAIELTAQFPALANSAKGGDETS